MSDLDRQIVEVGKVLDTQLDALNALGPVLDKHTRVILVEAPSDFEPKMLDSATVFAQQLANIVMGQDQDEKVPINFDLLDHPIQDDVHILFRIEATNQVCFGWINLYTSLCLPLDGCEFALSFLKPTSTDQDKRDALVKLSGITRKLASEIAKFS